MLSAIGILAVEFVRHLACAPFRLERDRANDGERRIGLLQERVRTLEVERAAAIECAAEGFGLGPDWA